MKETYTEVVRSLRERLNNLDQREIILQKTVARLEEKVDHLILGLKEQRAKERWLTEQVLAAVFATLAFFISLLQLVMTWTS